MQDFSLEELEEIYSCVVSCAMEAQLEDDIVKGKTLAVKVQGQQRALFQQHLHGMGYSVPLTSQVFDELLGLYLSGEWGNMIETEFRSIWIWKSHVAERLLEPFKVMTNKYIGIGKQSAIGAGGLPPKDYEQFKGEDGLYRFPVPPSSWEKEFDARFDEGIYGYGESTGEYYDQGEEVKEFIAKLLEERAE